MEYIEYILYYILLLIGAVCGIVVAIVGIQNIIVNHDIIGVAIAMVGMLLFALASGMLWFILDME